MSKEYGQNAPLSYNKYLRVPELIDLQTCLSSPAQHDELLFITVHQAYELWFKQILHEIDAAVASMKDDRDLEAVNALRRVVEIEKLLVAQIHILETMSPLRFLGFRDELNPASGFQSMQFREIEFSSGLKSQEILREFAGDDFAHARLAARMNAPSLSESFFALLRRRGFDTPGSDSPRDTKERRTNYGKRQRAIVEVMTHADRFYKEYQLAEALLEHDEYFSLWRSHHIKMVERMVGAKKGTGGSEGIRYLQTTLDKKFFPELWEARTYLTSKHDASKCPFAKT
ncbi:MAG TPA: tryptophan 2,3-dioxygenase family protein [Pyrinomonadaceae bacterium]|jgi:tryptophan 2,3-dioxygenase|nr:tryptophan 2,3-dioxygenase family protein [Pyrinomonadaceae bacterium]